MTPIEITLLVIGIIVGLYLVIVLLDIIFVLIFKSNLHKHRKSISVILATKLDSVKKLISIAQKLDVKIKDKSLKAIEEINVSDFDYQYTEICKKSRETLSMIANEIKSIGVNDEILSKHTEFQATKDNVEELDNVLRMNIALYNADVIGYNYWTAFMPTRFIYLMLKIRKKDIIS